MMISLHEAALLGLHCMRADVERRIAEIQGRLHSAGGDGADPEPIRRHWSPGARRAHAQRMRERWRKARAAGRRTLAKGGK